MTIPDFQSVMLPLLKFLSDRQEHSIREAIDDISNQFNLTVEEIQEPLPSGQQRIIDNRVGWARTYMKKAGLLEIPKRSYTKITDRGLDILSKNPEKINIKFLEQFPEFVEFRTIKKEQIIDKIGQKEKLEDQTPDDLMTTGYKLIIDDLSIDLLNRLRKGGWYFFESVVLELLKAMGYGKTEKTKKSGDGGVDGIIYEDKLGLGKIYIQAKRYAENNTVPIEKIRSFIGTLDSASINKGVFITTSYFPKDAQNIIDRTNKNIILIDGPKLVELMIENSVGVKTKDNYAVKEIDDSFFSEE